MRRRAAVSEVISAIVLSGVVLAVGGALWAYSLGAATVISNEYVNDTLSIVDEVTERFIIEKIFYDATNSKLVVWVYNYGDQGITADVYVDIVDFTPDPSSENLKIASGEHGKVKFAVNLNAGDQVIVNIYSWRQNNVQDQYTIP